MGRRLVAAVAGITMAAVALSTPALAAEPAATEFQVGIVVGEGPDRPSGSRFDFFASLVSGSDPVPGASVTLLGRSYGAKEFTPLATTTSGPDGGVLVVVTLQRTTEVRWSYAGDADHAASLSMPYVQQVGTKVVATAKRRSLEAGRRVVVVGRTAAVKAGQRVTLWRGQVPSMVPGPPTVRIGAATVRPDGTFRVSARLVRPGKKQLFVKVAGGRGTTDGYSRYLRIRVR